MVGFTRDQRPGNPPRERAGSPQAAEDRGLRDGGQARIWCGRVAWPGNLSRDCGGSTGAIPPNFRGYSLRLRALAPGAEPKLPGRPSIGPSQPSGATAWPQ
jgi:hypothetical protein